MAQRSLRFGIKNNSGKRAATWKLWTETSGGNSEVYLACRALGGTLKTSMHQSGKWHISFSNKTFEESVKCTASKIEDRFIEKWPRPADIAPGIILAYRIVTPYSSITSSTQDGGKYKNVKWLPNALESKATEIDILISKTETSINGWPGKNSMGTSLIGSFPLESGEIVWAVYWVIDMPDMSKCENGTLHFFNGKNKKDLKSNSLRALVFGAEPDGSRVIYDCTVENKNS